MKFNLGTIFTLLLLIPGISASAADSTHIRFDFASPLRSNEFTVTVHDGITEHTVDVVHHPYWSGILNAPYGFISVNYKNSDTTYLLSKVFFDKGNVAIHVIPVADTLKYFTIDEKASPHLISYDKAGGAAFDAFIKERFDIFIHYYQENRHRFGIDTAALEKGFRLGDTAFRRAVEKYGMDWPQVFGDQRLYEAMAYGFVPQLYLLDKSGRPIYNTTSIRDKDMTLLENILEERLGK